MKINSIKSLPNTKFMVNGFEVTVLENKAIAVKGNVRLVYDTLEQLMEAIGML